MRAADFLAAAAALPVASFEEVFGPGGIVVVAPHPDDESLGCGGLIAAARARGRDARIVVVSDGADSHPNSPSYPAPRLAALREREALAAAACLGVPESAVSFLRLPDARVPIAGEGADAAAARIAEVVCACEATTLLVTWEHDPHTDHRACAAIARLAAARCPGVRLLAYPIWGWSLPPDEEVGDPPRGVRLDVAAHAAAKAAAIAAHRSQTTDLIADDPEGFRLDAAVLARFAGPHEIVLEMAP